MKQPSIIGSALAAIALGSAAQAASIIGAINFSSSGGVVFQDSAGNATTDLEAATGIKEWLLPQVVSQDGSFISVSVPPGQSVPVSIQQPWIFNPSTPMNPLWTIAGGDNFSFNLSSSTVTLRVIEATPSTPRRVFLFIDGSGTLTSTTPGLDPTPATWFFSTQSPATEGKFSWSSTTVPELGTPALLGAALLGACFLRRRNSKPLSPKNNKYETNILPPDVLDGLAGPHLGNPS